MAECLTGVIQPAQQWSGKFVLTDLSAGVVPASPSVPSPIVPNVSVFLQYSNTDYVSLIAGPLDAQTYSTEYAGECVAWLNAWGIGVNYPYEYNIGVLDLRVEIGPMSGPIVERELHTYGWYREWDTGLDDFGPWTYYGPAGGDQGVDSFEFAWSLGMTEVRAKVESSSNPPAYRARQDFADDTVTYTGWFIPADVTCTYALAGMSGNVSLELPEDGFLADISLGFGLAYTSDSHFGGGFPTVVRPHGLSVLDTDHIAITEMKASGNFLLFLGGLNSVTSDGTTWTNYLDGNYPAGNKYLAHGGDNYVKLRRIGDPLLDFVPDEGCTWNGWAKPPYSLAVDYRPADFDRSETRTNPRLDIGLKNGDGTTPLYLGTGLSKRYRLPTYSWADYAALWLPSRALTAYRVEADLDASDENPEVERANDPDDPEGAKTTYHDRRCKLWAWPLTESDYTQPPFFNDDPDHRVLYIYQTGSINVNLPPGLGTRPSSWTAGAGATVDGSNNDLWTIAAGQDAATVYRNLETRFYYQMERLADHLDDPDYWHDEDAPRKLKANLPVVWEGYDEEDEGHVAVMEELSKPEDVTNWSNRSYLYAKLVGGAGLAVKVRLTYSTVEITDPWYTDFAYRFGAGGPYGEAEWEWSRTDGLVVTYSVDRDGLPMVLEAGDNELWVDLACPDENLVPILQHVDKIEFLFDSSDLTEPAQVTLDILSLRPSDREGEPWYETQHFLCDSKQAWDWYRRNFFGVGWVFDGLPNAQVDLYGHGKFANEKGFCYLKYQRHSPAYTGPFSDLTVAYPLSYLADLFSWQEGFAATYDADALAYYLTDADGNSLGTPAWWWIAEDADRELRDDDHEDGPQQLRLGLAVGTLNIEHLRGPDLTIYVEHNAGGKPHGIAKRGQKRARMKGGVRVYWRETAEGQETEWALLGSGTPDRHGRWRGPNCIEDGTTGHTHDRSREYRVSRGAELGAAVNRSYWWEGAAVQVQGGGGLVSMYTDPTGVEWCAWVQGTNVYLARKENAPHTWGTAQVIDSSGDYDSASVTGDGRKISVACHKISDDKVYEFLCDSTGAKTSGPFLIGN